MATAKKAAKKAPAKKAAAKKAPAKKAAAKKAVAKKAVPAKKAPAKKAPAKKAVAKKAPAKKAAKKAAAPKKKRAPNPALMKALTPSGPLAAIIGSAPVPRPGATKKIWDYIKKHGLQDKTNKRMINADDKLKALFGGKGQASMFDLAKFVSQYLK
ncbi:MAG TPA: SWIB/MDM2 domain-containing protein [Burkholderiaceae bacterium]|nr:SWIB/MDM2 domain-containing protein [Burkholderiaceae bacterium]